MQKSVNTTLKTAPDFLPNIRIKHDESAEIQALVDEFLNRGGSIKTTIKPTVFVSEFGRKPNIAPVDTAVWKQKDEVSRIMTRHRILTGTLARNLKIAPKFVAEFFKGTRYPTLETQERIMKSLSELIAKKEVSK
jgi:hypothetical protein